MQVSKGMIIKKTIGKISDALQVSSMSWLLCIDNCDRINTTSELIIHEYTMLKPK